jgi:hypothetical protein
VEAWKPPANSDGGSVSVERSSQDLDALEALLKRMREKERREVGFNFGLVSIFIFH